MDCCRSAVVEPSAVRRPPFPGRLAVVARPGPKPGSWLGSLWSSRCRGAEDFRSGAMKATAKSGTCAILVLMQIHKFILKHSGCIGMHLSRSLITLLQRSGLHISKRCCSRKVICCSLRVCWSFKKSACSGSPLGEKESVRTVRVPQLVRTKVSLGK